MTSLTRRSGQLMLETRVCSCCQVFVTVSCAAGRRGSDPQRATRRAPVIARPHAIVIARPHAMGSRPGGGSRDGPKPAQAGHLLFKLAAGIGSSDAPSPRRRDSAGCGGLHHSIPNRLGPSAREDHLQAGPLTRRLGLVRRCVVLVCNGALTIAATVRGSVAAHDRVRSVVRLPGISGSDRERPRPDDRDPIETFAEPLRGLPASPNRKPG